MTEAEILDDGNIFKGTKGGTATSNEGLTISADNFEYNKKINILNASGNVKIEDSANDQIIFSEKIIYIKIYEEKIITKGLKLGLSSTQIITFYQVILHFKEMR